MKKNRKHWKETVSHGKPPEPEIQIPRNNAERERNVLALESLRLAVYPALRKGLRMDKTKEVIRRAKR